MTELESKVIHQNFAIITTSLLLLQLFILATSKNIIIIQSDSDDEPSELLTDAQESALAGLKASSTNLSLSLDWLSTAGGSGGDDIVNAVATDSAGNAIVTGSVSYNVTLGTLQVSAPSGTSGFVAKLSPFGYWIWAIALVGGSSNIVAIDVDSNGMIYIVGNTYDQVSAGAYTLGSSGSEGFFVAKVNPQGAWVWAKPVVTSGSWWSEVTDVTVDDNGNTAIVGHFSSTITIGSHSLSSNGGTDIFVAKLNSGGTNWLWAKTFGGVNYDYGNAIDTWEIGTGYEGECNSHLNNIVITGAFTEYIEFGDYNFSTARYNSSAYVTWICGDDGGVFSSIAEGVPASSSSLIEQWYSSSDFSTWALGTGWVASTGSSNVDSCVGSANGYSWQYIYTYDCDYSNGLTTTSYATSPTVSGAGYSSSPTYSLEFDRLLGIESNYWDNVVIQVYANGLWNTIWNNPSTMINEISQANQTWTKVQYDISNYFPGNAFFKVRFGIGPTDSTISFTGWNIDNVKIIQGEYSIPSRTTGWDIESWDTSNWGDDVTCVALGGTGSGVIRFMQGGTNFATGGYDDDVFVAPICYLDGYGPLLAYDEMVFSEANYISQLSIDANYLVTITGSFTNTVDFGSTTLVSNGGSDIFVATISDFAQSSGFTWDEATRGGGSGDDYATSHTFTSTGATIVGGYIDGESQFGTTHLSAYSGNDGLIAQLGSSGTWSWVEQVGGAGGSDYAWGADILSDGSSVMVGAFQGVSDFGTSAITSSGGYDGYIVIYEPDGSVRQVESFGGDETEYAFNVVEGDSGALYVTGYMDCIPNSIYILGKWVSCPNMNNSGSAWFIAKLNSQLQASWVQTFGMEDGWGEVIHVEEYNDGSLLTCGSHSRGTLTIGSFSDTIEYFEATNLFCTRLSAGSGSPIWMTTVEMNGKNEELGDFGFEINSQDIAYLTGSFEGTASFGSVSTIASAGSEGTSDIFVAALGSAGNWAWAIAGGGQNNDYGNDIFLDGDGNLKIIGSIMGSAALGNTMLTGSDSWTNYPYIATVTNSGSWSYATLIDASIHASAISSSSLTDDLHMVWFKHDGTLTLDSNILSAPSGGAESTISIGMYNSSSETWQAAEEILSLFDDSTHAKLAVHFTGLDANREGRAIIAGSYRNAFSPISGQQSITDGSQNVFLITFSFDADGDGLLNSADSCPYGASDWLSSPSTDYDSDGCKDDDVEDPDDDNDGRLDPLDSANPLWGEDRCERGELDWSSEQSVNDYDVDGCLDTSPEDSDDDNDGVPDPANLTFPTNGEDFCHQGTLNWTSSTLTDYDGDGCKDADAEDPDDDNDGIPDPADPQSPSQGEDYCPRGDRDWISGEMTDYDGDGCRDDGEDLDDDGDGIPDEADGCPIGTLGWTPSTLTDHDSDGCRDDGEDLDDDGDGIPDEADGCPIGTIGWTPSTLTDHDSDGCRDDGEDLDDDNDTISDSDDDCPRGVINWDSDPTTTDYDSDGCHDDYEDLDDDNDQIPDPLGPTADVGEDYCARGELGWNSTSDSDHDGDGCRDDGEDLDDDRDNRIDSEDACPTGMIGWDSQNTTLDHDSDGCRDDEDMDDDGDSILDPSVENLPQRGEDYCAKGMTGWISNSQTDNDGDGCNDNTEDSDDDNDGIEDEKDLCARGEIGWVSVISTDLDRDGCRDIDEDDDDDGDGILDEMDSCALGETSWESTVITDKDGDGCRDIDEDDDDDGDGIIDSKQFMLSGEGAFHTWTLIFSIVGGLLIIAALLHVVRRGGSRSEMSLREQIVEEVMQEVEYKQITSELPMKETPSLDEATVPEIVSDSSQLAQAMREFPSWSEEQLEGYFEQGWTLEKLREWVNEKSD